MSSEDKPGLSKTAIDRLGDRLRKDQTEEADLRLLHEFRRSFRKAYDFVVSTLRNELGLQPTGRPAKSTASIREKLRRETIRLSQIQDIAGCRVVVDSIREQDAVIEALRTKFTDVNIVDRRQTPSNAYRAVHAIASRNGCAVEIQIRTLLQHKWAELSEKLADVVDPAIKYGGGPEVARGILEASSKFVAGLEDSEAMVERSERQLEELDGKADAARIQQVRDAAQKIRAEHRRIRQEQFEIMTDAIRKLEEL